MPTRSPPSTNSGVPTGATRTVPFRSPGEIEMAIGPSDHGLLRASRAPWAARLSHRDGLRTGWRSGPRGSGRAGAAQGPHSRTRLFSCSWMDLDMVADLGLRLEGAAAVLAAQHWPGPLTLVLPGGDERIPDALRGPEGGVAVRWSPHPGMARLSGPIAARSRRPAPTRRGFRRLCPLKRLL